MLVDLSKNENEILESIRNSEKYKSGNFQRVYITAFAEIKRVIEAAKIYVLDNYQKVEDYSDLHLMIRCANHSKTCYFGKKSKTDFPRSGSKVMARILKEIDNETIEITSLDKSVYDWTDGDFSVVINGVDYNWIDDNSIVDIADYIEKRLSN